MDIDPWRAGVFVLVVVAFYVTDLMSHRKDQRLSVRKAALWSALWVSLSLSFSVFLFYSQGAEEMTLFLTGYFLEQSLSIDNMFVFMAVFASFSIGDRYQHRVLYYGIIGAVVLRLLFVALGTSLFSLGDWVLVLFGVLVLWTAWKMWQATGQDACQVTDYTHHWSVRLTRKILPIHPRLQGHNFMVRNGDSLAFTPLFLCLVCVEVVDVVFAVDSVPAVIAVTRKPFLVYTSNIFAVLGLRSLYFLLCAARRSLVHLDKAVVTILAYVGIKMLLAGSGISHIPSVVSLCVVLGVLALGMLTSILFPSHPQREKVGS